MVRSFSVLVVLMVGFVGSIQSLKCYEGFNMTMNGIPLYHWKERTCNANSRCIGQQIGVDLKLNGAVAKHALRYGACVANAYADYLDCDNLFGRDSNFDAAKLLDLIPEIEKSIQFMSSNFAQNTMAELEALLSDGTGMESFVSGIFTFYENLGFNFEKLRPLEPSLANLLSSVFKPQDLHTALIGFFDALANLDTDNDGFRSSLRSLLGKLNSTYLSQIDSNPQFAVMVDKLPGLVRSIFPSSWQPELWYDVCFKLIANVDPSDWTKSAQDMVSTIKSSYQIPNDTQQYVIPILDRIPDLVKGSLTNNLYGGQWSLDLLEYFSPTDKATTAFSMALANFIEPIMRQPLQREYKKTIELIPGLFYRFFPGDKSVIQKVYRTMADGFNTFNFTEMGDTAPETKLSTMINNLILAIGGPQAQRQVNANPFLKAVIINFSHTFYNLMNVTTDYTTYVDNFATVIDDGFKEWPKINGGAIIANLVTEMGGKVPPELKPLLDNLQPVITASMASPFNASSVVQKMYEITDAYKKAFPDSPFPDLARRYINIMYRLLTPPPSARATNALNMELQYWNIDLQFAIVKSAGYTDDELYKMAVEAWPDYDLYIRIMRAMNPEDVKRLLKNIMDWISTPPLTTDRFVKSVKPVFMEITKSIKDLMGEIRHMYTPHSCQFGSCDKDLCNAHSYITEKPVMKRPLTFVTQSTSTTSAGERASTYILLNIFTLWIAHKFVMS